jgi:hypothetical protein
LGIVATVLTGCGSGAGAAGAGSSEGRPLTTPDRGHSPSAAAGTDPASGLKLPVSSPAGSQRAALQDFAARVRADLAGCAQAVTAAGQQLLLVEGGGTSALAASEVVDNQSDRCDPDDSQAVARLAAETVPAPLRSTQVDVVLAALTGWASTDATAAMHALNRWLQHPNDLVARGDYSAHTARMREAAARAQGLLDEAASRFGGATPLSFGLSAFPVLP